MTEVREAEFLENAPDDSAVAVANFDILGTTVRVESASLEQLQYWSTVYAPMRSSGHADIVVRILNDPSEDTPLEATLTIGGVVRRWDGREPLLPPLATPPLDRWLYLKGAVVGRAGHAVVLLAAEGAGKTTLSLASVARGAWLLCDGVVPLDPQDLLVAPLHMSLRLRQESLDLLDIATDHPALRPFRARSGDIEWRADPLQLLGNRTAVASADVAAVVVLESSHHGRAPELESQSALDAVQSLVGHLAVTPSDPSNAVDAFVRLVQRVPAYRLRAGSPQQTAAVLDELLL